MESEARSAGVQPKREAKLLTVIGLPTMHAVCACAVCRQSFSMKLM